MWKNFVSPFTALPEDIVPYLTECSRDQLIIRNLVKRNKDLQELINKNNAGVLTYPNFLLEMVQHEARNRNIPMNHNRYEDHMKEISLYIYILAGRIAYETLQRNLPAILPSITTLRKVLAKKSQLKEGEFRFDYIRDQLVAKGEPLVVICSDDDTRITRCLRYDYKNDQVVGLQLPLNDDGVPIVRSFPFTSLKDVQEYMKNHKENTYFKLLTARTLGKSCSTYHLALFGTRGSDVSTEVRARWRYIDRGFADVGVKVIGESRSHEVNKKLI